jgi:threonine aldolase
MIIDLRSDTVTKPTEEMLQVMFEAKVGDDVFGDDPTVNELEKRVAGLFGKESAIFCPSGTMTNQIAIKIHTNSPGELICDELSHVYKYEGGGIGFNSGLATKLIKGDFGRLSLEQVESAINPDDIHFPETQLVSLENTCNKGGGTIYSLNQIEKIRQLCIDRGLKLHLDGARIFNALVEVDYSAKDIGKQFDTISVCLSKGLGAPIGSLLLGSKEDIKKARRIRKLLGGGMRQAGYLAAAGIYALDNNIERLKEDHLRAKRIAENITDVSYIKNVWPVYTNILIFEIEDNVELNQLIEKLAKQNLRVSPFGPQLIRIVTHLDFNDEMLDETIKILQNIKY